MKKSILISLVFLFAFSNVRALEKRDSTSFLKLKKKIDSLAFAFMKNKNCVNCFTDTTRRSGFIYNENGHFIYSARTLNTGHWILIFLPVFLFGCILFYTLGKLNRDKFSLSDALSENFTITVDIPNPQPSADGSRPLISSNTTPRSVSRLIAFLSGLAALSIGVCATSYYFYIYLKTGISPNLDNLFNILLGLGIGVMPYAFNRMSAAFTGNR